MKKCIPLFIFLLVIVGGYYLLPKKDFSTQKEQVLFEEYVDTEPALDEDVVFSIKKEPYQSFEYTKKSRQRAMSSLQKNNKKEISLKKEKQSPWDLPSVSLGTSSFQRKASQWIVRRTNIDSRVALKISRAAERLEHGMMLMAMIIVESFGNPRQKTANNYGLVQVSDVHLRRGEIERLKRTEYNSIDVCGVSSVHDLYDIEKNMCAANVIFSRIYDKQKNNVRSALMHYNANDRLKHRYKEKVLKEFYTLAEALGASKKYIPGWHNMKVAAFSQ